MATPKSVQELKSFLGFTCYCGVKFVQDSSILPHDLRQLTHKDVPWHWTKAHDAAIAKLKEALCRGTKLSYFNVDRATELNCDASLVGLCASFCKWMRTARDT